MSNPQPKYFLTITALAEHINRIEDPQEAAAALCGGLIANLLGHINDEQWRRMRAVEAYPCGRSGCDCSLHHGQVMDALDTQREDWKEHV